MRKEKFDFLKYFFNEANNLKIQPKIDNHKLMMKWSTAVVLENRF